MTEMYCFNFTVFICNLLPGFVNLSRENCSVIGILAYAKSLKQKRPSEIFRFAFVKNVMPVSVLGPSKSKNIQLHYKKRHKHTYFRELEFFLGLTILDSTSQTIQK